MSDEFFDRQQAEIVELSDEIARLSRERDQLRDAARLVTSFIKINAKMSGPERVGVNSGAGLRQAIFDLDDLIANTEKETGG